MTKKGDDAAMNEDMERMEAEGWTLQQDSCAGGSSHEFKVDEPLEGTVRGVKDIKVRRGREFVKTRLMTLLTGGGIVKVWESAALSGLFEVAAVGDSVCIEYLGEVEMPAPKSPMKDYRVWVRPHGEA